MKHASLTIVTSLLLMSLTAVGQNAVTDWNAIGITAARASTAPGSATAGGTGIYMAYVQLAVYNAVNAIDGRFQPYKYSLNAPVGASADAAAIEASYRTLLYLVPDQATYLTAQYDTSQAAIPDGDAKTKGQALGLASANALNCIAGWGWAWSQYSIQLSFHSNAGCLDSHSRRNRAADPMDRAYAAVYFRRSGAVLT